MIFHINFEYALLVRNNMLCFFVKYVNLVNIKCKFNCIAGLAVVRESTLAVIGNSAKSKYK